MKNSFLDDIDSKIKKKFYTDSDVLDCQFVFQLISERSDKDSRRSLASILATGEFKEIVLSGELPNLNPGFELYSKGEDLDVNLLAEYIVNNSYYLYRDLDVSKFHVKIFVPIKVLFLNFRSIDRASLEKISGIDINSFMGEFKIGKKKNIQ